MKNMSVSAMRKNIKAFVPAAVKNQVKKSLGKQVQFLTHQDINSAHRRFFAQAKEVDSKAWQKRIFDVAYGKESAVNIMPASDLKFAQSWVAFYRGQTSVQLFNFFEKNYGIRDPMYFRFYFVNAQKEILHVESRVLESGAVELFERDGDLFCHPNLPESGSLIIQAFHPRIKIISDQLRFFVFYGSKTGNAYQAGVHSLLVPEQGNMTPTKVGYRNAGIVEQTHLATMANSEMPAIDLKLKDSLGEFTNLDTKETIHDICVFLQKDERGNFTGIWHDGPDSHRAPVAEQKRQFGNTQTGIFIPDLKANAPRLHFSEHQIGFRPESASFHLYDEKYQLLASKRKTLGQEQSLVDAKELFEAELQSGPASIVVEFDRDLGEFAQSPTAYLQVYYRGQEEAADNIHSLASPARAHASYGVSKSYRCRKFAPLIHSDDVEMFYSIHNVSSVNEGADDHIFVRVFSDKFTDVRYRLELVPNKINHFNARDVLDRAGLEVDKSAIVYLESNCTNFNASWFVFNKSNQALATDHFTGA